MTETLMLVCNVCHEPFDYLSETNPDLDRCRPCREAAERKPAPEQLPLPLL